MSRPVVLGNGSMLVGLDKFGMVHDFYYPYVGLENHATARNMHHRIGVFVDDHFSWLDSGSWQISLDYEEDAMISFIKATNDHLQVALEFHDFVDANSNVFARNVHVVNNSDHHREIRVFFHQFFQISDSNRGDTALYEPDGGYILDYKGRRSFLIYAQTASGEKFDQFSIGVHGIEGKEGTYKDAEDGELSGNPVEHGLVDSTIRLKVDVKGLSSERIHYWIVAASSHHDALKIHKKYVKQGLDAHYSQTQKHWHTWLETAEDELEKIPSQYHQAVKKSLFIMKSHIDRRGAIIASGDSEMLNYERDNYSYCWPRDAGYVLWPLIRMGFSEEPKAFFEFARDVITDEGALMHKFQPDRAIGSTWHPLVHKGEPEMAIQEDETAIVLFMLHEFLLESEDEDFIRRLYSTLIQPAANFLERFIDKETMLPHASYDLWEEKFLTSTYTVAVTYAGLMAASRIAEQFEYPDDSIRWQSVAQDIKSAAHKTLFNKNKGYFHKGYLLDNGNLNYDETIDASSLYGAIMFGLYPVEHPEVQASVRTLESQLLNKSRVGGLPRYEYDRYFSPSSENLGNPWFVTTLWLAQIYNELGRPQDAMPLIDWATSKMLKSGVLSEQLNPDSGEFLSVAPLIWSHAEIINTILDVYV